MMDYLQEQTLSCPYCGESIDVLIDPQDAGDQYIEDCQVRLEKPTATDI